MRNGDCIVSALKETNAGGTVGHRQKGGGRAVAVMPHNVLAVANEFIDRANRDKRRVTPMLLQKLCYLAHGFNLALFSRPLTRDRIEAWDYGPVYPDLYDAFKKYGSGEVAELICSNNWALSTKVKGDVVRSKFDDKESRLIETVWSDYGNFDAFKLSALTHADNTPWTRVYVPQMKSFPIHNDLIKEYFDELTAAPVA